MTAASAAGKVILCGEHAVVYGRPAIAVPVSDLRASAEITPLPPGSGVLLVAQDLGQTYRLDDHDESDTAHALRATVRNTLASLGVKEEEQALRIVVQSQIPVARGLGSGTAVATALVRALAAHFGHHLTARAVSDLVYRTEVIFHGTPSGIDNTVVAFEKPVYFVKGKRTDIFWVGHPFTLLIADTGISSKTRDAVARVRLGREAAPARFEALFDAVARVVQQAQSAIAAGDLAALGQLLSRNHDLLCQMGVSSPELDRLVAAACGAGALGAKLSGGGIGGCLIALVDAGTRDHVARALQDAGAASVMGTTVQ